MGLGAGVLEPVATDDQGAIDVAELDTSSGRGPDGPTIVCLQAGNVNSGAFDDFTAAIAAAHRHGAWAHVDGAFGLWAAANPATRHLMAGAENADSWATDGHKWLNVPYDSGYVFCAHPRAHAASMSMTASYLTGQGQGGLERRATTCPSRPPGPGLCHLGRPAPAGPLRRGRTGGAVLRPGPPLCRPARRRSKA